MELPEARLASFFETVLPHLGERQRRIMVGAMAVALGRGGQARVVEASGMSSGTIYKAVKEVRAGVEVSDRQRVSGGGDKPAIDRQPGLLEALDALMSPQSRRLQISPLRWTLMSTYELASQLRAAGFEVSAELVRRLLGQMGYSLQPPAKRIEGASHPDREMQFAYLNELVAERVRACEPVISIDTKKKELIRHCANVGKGWRRRGDLQRVNPTMGEFGNKLPYDIHEIGSDEGWVNVGDVADLAELAVESIRRWWETLGRERFPTAKTLTVTADAGGSRGHYLGAWMRNLAKLSIETGLAVTVLHHPPGTSKWDRIEHRLVTFTSMSWRGQPLTQVRTIVEMIASTSTTSGLTIQATFEPNWQAKGVKIIDPELSSIPVLPHNWHGEWNYAIDAR